MVALKVGFFAIGLTFLAVGLTSRVKAAESSEEHHHKMKCLGEVIEHSKKNQDADKECGAIFDISAIEKDKDLSSAERKEKWSVMFRCFKACTYRKMGVLVDDAKPEFNMDMVDEWVDAQIPDAARAGLKTDVKACLGAVKTPLTDADSCKSHETYQMCIMKAYKLNCKIEDDEEE